MIEAAENFYSQDKLSGTDPFMLKRAAKLAAGNIAIETGAEQRVVVEEKYLAIKELKRLRRCCGEENENRNSNFLVE